MIGWEPHPPEIIGSLEDGDDIVYGSRFVRSADELVYFLVNPTNRTANARITVAPSARNGIRVPTDGSPVAPGIDAASFTFLDCYRGSDAKFKPLVAGSVGNLRVPVEGLGLGESCK